MENIEENPSNEEDELEELLQFNENKKDEIDYPEKPEAKSFLQRIKIKKL